MFHNITISSKAIFLVMLCALFMQACASVQQTANTYTGAQPAANEAAVLMTLKTVASAQQNYFVRTGSAYGTFDQLVQTGVLDTRFSGSTPVVQGYALTMSVVTPSSSRTPGYSLNADPQPSANRPNSGVRHYFMDATGIVHYNDTRPATATDPTVK